MLDEVQLFLMFYINFETNSYNVASQSLPIWFLSSYILILKYLCTRAAYERSVGTNGKTFFCKSLDLFEMTVEASF